jgi:hypothetical protein
LRGMWKARQCVCGAKLGHRDKGCVFLCRACWGFVLALKRKYGCVFTVVER